MSSFHRSVTFRLIKERVGLVTILFYAFMNRLAFKRNHIFINDARNYLAMSYFHSVKSERRAWKLVREGQCLEKIKTKEREKANLASFIHEIPPSARLRMMRVPNWA